VPKDRSILLVKLVEAEEVEDDSDETRLPGAADTVALGSPREIKELLAQFNISEDGSTESTGVLFGPGLVAQLPMVGPDDPVMQIMVSMNEEDMAWAVLPRMCRVLGWKMMDPRSGRTFG
jgi:hypothetical protein